MKRFLVRESRPIAAPAPTLPKPVPLQLPRLAALVLLLPALFILSQPLPGQSVLERTPNLAGGWVGTPGQAHFNFLHRFRLVDSGDESIPVNTPTLLLASSLPGSALVGFQYASSSGVTSGNQNEWELFGRWTPLRANEGGTPLDLSLTGAYNAGSSSADGEVLLGLPVGPLRLLGVARVFSDQAGRGETGWAAGGGGILRLSDGIALAGDVISSPDLPASRMVAWGAALQLRVPLTPHSLSLQATNTRTGTLLGSSEGRREAGGDGAQVLWGFEFTIPITFSRYFGGGGGEDSPRGGTADGGAGAGGAGGDAGGAAAPAEVRVTMDALRFTPSRTRVRAGGTVTWENTSSVVHTVTADPGRADRASSVALPEGAGTFHSGDLRPGETFARTFPVPGEYVYFCVPHEGAGMVATVVVTE